MELESALPVTRSRSKVDVVTGKLGVVQQSQLQNDFSGNGGQVALNIGGDFQGQAETSPQDCGTPGRQSLAVPADCAKWRR